MRLRLRYLPFAVVFLALIALGSVIVAAFVRGRKLTRCSNCRSNRLRPSWPTIIDRFVLAPFGVTPWRCEACRKRFYLRK